MRDRHYWLWACVALLLVGFAVRAHHIEALPPFNDESHHIRRAEEVFTFTNRDLNLTLGKLLSYYWIGLFGAERLDAIFIGRTSTALFSLLGLAGTFMTARLLFGRGAGLIALLLAVFSPFMIFFDRMALTDPLTAALAVILIGASVKMMRGDHNHLWDRRAILVGLLCGLVVMAKLLGLPLVAVPLLAIVCFNREPLDGTLWHKAVDLWHTYRPMLVTVYSTFLLTMLPFVWHLIDRVLFAGTLVPVVNNNLISGAAEDKAPFDVLTSNLQMWWETHVTLHSPLLVIVLFVAAGILLWQRRQIGLYLLGSVALAWSLSIVVAAELSTRYLTLGVLPSFVIIAGGLSLLPRRPLWWSALTLTLIAWLAGFAIPFIAHAWQSPTELDLPERDRWEYYENFSAGYGLIEAAERLETLPRSQPSNRINVLGLVGSCHQLRLYLDEFGPVWLECPFFGWQGEYMDDVARTVDERLANESMVYLLVEPDLPFTDLSRLHVRWELIERFPRPFDGMTVELYRIYPED